MDGLMRGDCDRCADIIGCPPGAVAPTARRYQHQRADFIHPYRKDTLLPLHLLLDFPLQASDPAFDVAGRANQVVLERDFFQPSVTGAPQSVGAGQFAVGAFNGVALFHLLLKSLRLHLAPTRLQRRVMLADDQGPMLLPVGHALGSQ